MKLLIPATKKTSSDYKGEDNGFQFGSTETSSDQHGEEREARLDPTVQARIGSSIRSESTRSSHLLPDAFPPNAFPPNVLSLPAASATSNRMEETILDIDGHATSNALFSFDEEFEMDENLTSVSEALESHEICATLSPFDTPYSFNTTNAPRCVNDDGGGAVSAVNYYERNYLFSLFSYGGFRSPQIQDETLDRQISRRNQESELKTWFS